MDIQKILEQAVESQVSDIFLIAGLSVSFRKNGVICHEQSGKLMPADTENMICQLYQLADNRPMETLLQTGDDDFSFSIKGLSRFRVSAFKQRGSLSVVIRIIRFELPDYKELHIPEMVMNLSNERKGLILVTGAAGSGKSTTLACIIDKINHSRSSHVITLEDPLEFLHTHKKSIVSQREISTDSDSYITALRAALRQSPDVVLLGEMRDYETINTAVTASETGHVVFSSLHTIGASNTIDRIIDAFPASQQHQICIQLSSVLQAVVSQKLLPTVDGKVIPAFEIMVLTPAIRNLIRERKIHQIDGIIYTSSSENMIAMDTSIFNLYQKGIISKETAISEAVNPEIMRKRISLG